MVAPPPDYDHLRVFRTGLTTSLSIQGGGGSWLVSVVSSKYQQLKYGKFTQIATRLRHLNRGMSSQQTAECLPRRDSGRVSIKLPLYPHHEVDGLGNLLK